MRVRDLLRDVVLMAAVAAVGWWCHGAGTPVGAETEGTLAFQFMPGSDQSSLSIYSQSDRTLYVYPHVAVGNSLVSCQYMFHLHQLGGAIERENCKPGSQLP